MFGVLGGGDELEVVISYFCEHNKLGDFNATYLSQFFSGKIIWINDICLLEERLEFIRKFIMKGLK